MIYTDLLMLLTVVLLTIIGNQIIRTCEKARKNKTFVYLFIAAISAGCYLYSDRKHFIYFFISVAFNILVGRLLNKIKNGSLRKGLFLFSVTADVLLLITCKIFISTDKLLALPLGLSFFTFREISYLTDIYKQKKETPFDLAADIAYIMMFTQIQSGPITVYGDFENSRTDLSAVSDTEFINGITCGIKRIMIGFAKKVLVADSLNVIVFSSFKTETRMLSLPMAWLGAICFSLQLYYDFSGYSDMAIGMTNILGFRCLENFDHPYASSSISEFWRRWHITLGAWFREYVYIPLGGSRVSKPRIALNLLTVWLLTGLWHGIDLSFLIWGMIHFAFVCIEHFSSINKTENKKLKLVWRIVTLLAVILAWVMFKADNISQGLLYIKSMFVSNPETETTFALHCIKSYWWLISSAAIFSLPAANKLKEWFCAHNKEKVYDTLSSIVVVLMFAVSLALFSNRENDTFAYANF